MGLLKKKEEKRAKKHPKKPWLHPYTFKDNQQGELRSPKSLGVIWESEHVRCGENSNQTQIQLYADVVVKV